MSKTANGLVEYCLAQVGKPYWYGTYGQTATERLYLSKKEQYPKYYNWANDYPEQYGQRVHDCTGLTEGYLMSETPTSRPVYRSKYDFSANGLLKACKESGSIDTIPEIPGVCVFYSGHTGVYIGNGEVVEARGHAYGVVITKLSERPWSNWGKHPYIDYENEEEVKTVEVELKVLRKGMKGYGEIETLQRLLVSLGYKDSNGKVLEIDCSFGGKTLYAVKNYQKDNDLEVDGVVGRKTWNCLLGV